MATVISTQPALTESNEDSASDGEEPWDVQRAHSEDASSKQTPSVENNADPAESSPSPSTMGKPGSYRRRNDDDIGDLPALSISKSGEEFSQNSGSVQDKNNSAVKRVLSGQRTVRPLSPPSLNGMSKGSQEEQNRDDSETEDEWEDDEDDDDMPMDEREDRRQRKREAALSLCVDTETQELGSNLCDYALTALGDVCGGASNSAEGGTSAPPKKKRPQSQSPPLTLPKQSVNYNVDEQTAIEVEYVEPTLRRKQALAAARNVLSSDATSDVSSASGASPRRKNAMLNRIAQKAKDDFQKKAPSKRSEAPPPPDNVYSTFNPSEKRKFLKLINSGLTPTDATSQVLKEREEGENAMDQTDDDSSKDSRTPSLAFLKKSGDEASIPTEVTNQAATSPSADARDDPNFAKSGINYYDAVRKESNVSDHEESTDDDTSDQDDEIAAATKKSRKTKNRLAKFVKKGFSPLEEKKSNRGLFSRGRGASPKADAVEEPRDLGRNIITAQESSSKKSPTSSSESNEGTPRSAEEVKATPPPPPPPSKTPPAAPRDSKPAVSGESGEAGSIVKPIPIKAEAQMIDKSLQITKSVSNDSQDSLLRDDIGPMEGTIDSRSMSIEEDVQSMLLGRSPEKSGSVSKASTPRSKASTAAGSMASTPGSKGSIEESKNGDQMEMGLPLNIDTYLNSTEMMSQYGGASAHDHMSVVSGRSYKTSGTTGTNYTTSTRSRRPGASKQRLIAQKKAEQKLKQKKPRGWQESIQAAAAGTGRVWDPEKGWVDYVDPDAITENPENRTVGDDKIHISLDKMKLSKSNDEGENTREDQTGQPVAVPFPETWQQERNAMLQGEPDKNRSIDSRSPRRKTTEQRSNEVSPPSNPPSPNKNRGWVETMKAATAKINQDGKRWDPQKGWIGLDDGDATTVDGSRYNSGSISVQHESDTQDFGVSAVQTPDKTTNLQRKVSEDSAESEDNNSRLGGASTKSGISGRYMQIGDTGSVKSHYRNTRPASAVVPLASTPETPGTREAFGNLDEAHREHNQRSVGSSNKSTVLVNVVKEKVDPADASLFPERNSRTGGRGSGPVDVDTVDEDDENATFDNDNINFSWDADSDTNPSSAFPKGQTAVPRLKISMRDSSPKDRSTAPGGQLSSTPSDSQTRSERASDSGSSTGRKSIPRLPGPKRDTSPIRGRKSNNKQQISPPTEVEAVRRDRERSPPQEFQTVESRQPNPMPLHRSIDPSADSQGTSLQDDGPAPPAAQRSIPSREQAQPIAKTPTRNPVDSKSSPLADSSPSSVKLKTQYWESRSNSGSPDDNGMQQMPTQAIEWKQFLAKKVQAESAAAANHQESHGASNGSDFDRDSIFDFPESEGAFPTAPRSKAGQSRLPPGDSRQKNVQSRTPNNKGLPQPGAFDDISDLSPIRKQDEDYDDDETPSETSSYAVQPKTFLQRLQACAAPIIPRNVAGDASCDSTSLPMAHLAFLKSNPSVNGTPEKARFTPPNLCGRPDVIREEGEDEEDTSKEVESRQREERPRSRSNPRSSRQSDVSSVISDEAYGQKTAYLESIAMKAAVSSSKKKRRSPGSDVSGSSSKHSEKWQKFLEKKGASGTKSPSNRSSNEDVSKAAEKYAAEKVEEMMELMSKRSQTSDFQSRPMEEATGGFPVLDQQARVDDSQRKADSAKAAEDLAAARVEAMMQALSSQNLDEGEI